MPNLPVAARRLGPSVGWSKADPKLRDWVMKNREALELFGQAALRADGVANPARERRDSIAYLDLHSLVWLARLEGARLQEQGLASPRDDDLHDHSRLQLLLVRADVADQGRGRTMVCSDTRRCLRANQPRLNQGEWFNRPAVQAA